MAAINPVVLDGAVEIRVLNNFSGTLTVANWTAGVDITCDLLGTGLNRSMNENAITIDRLCSRQTGEAPGSFAESVDLTYAWAPQSVATDTAYATLVPDSEKFLAVRYGVPWGTAGATGQKVDVIRTKPGRRQRVPVARNEESRVMQKQYIPADGVTYDLALT
jgi:hypothetical protein